MSNANEHPTTADLFGLLDEWRHLPAYQLERRADIFFGLFLPEVLGKHFGIDIKPHVVPEFPIKKSNRQSKKADYLALSEDGKRAFLVELKTDMASRRETQDKYLDDAVVAGLQKLVIGVLDICVASTQKSKYVHLLKLLSDIGLIEYEDDLFPVRQGYSRVLKSVRDAAEKREKWPDLEVVYVQPRSTGIIDFREFADLVEEGGEGEIRSRFARSLRTWATNKAGSPKPKDWQS